MTIEKYFKKWYDRLIEDQIENFFVTEENKKTIEGKYQHLFYDNDYNMYILKKIGFKEDMVI